MTDKDGLRYPESGQADLFRALAHPVRLRILAVLAPGEACVCQVQARLGLRQAQISQHLMALRRAGLVVCRRAGLRIYYRAACPDLYRLLAAARAFLAVAGLQAPEVDRACALDPGGHHQQPEDDLPRRQHDDPKPDRVG